MSIEKVKRETGFTWGYRCDGASTSDQRNGWDWKVTEETGRSDLLAL